MREKGEEVREGIVWEGGGSVNVFFFESVILEMIVGNVLFEKSCVFGISETK